MSGVLLEVAVTTAEDAAVAAEAGADRLELCSALEVGGVTPSMGLFEAAREAVSIPIVVLLRPRPGRFVYSPTEIRCIERDAAWFMERGANGIVCGILHADGKIDRKRCSALVSIAPGKAVFHRAFDFIADRPAALEELVQLGFQRVLTSGGAATAIAGRHELTRFIAAASDRIEILPGGGILPQNATQLIRETGCRQVHASLRGTSRSPNVLAMGEHRPVDPVLVRGMRKILDSMKA